jgi:hypothetical protein
MSDRDEKRESCLSENEMCRDYSGVGAALLKRQNSVINSSAGVHVPLPTSKLFF